MTLGIQSHFAGLSLSNTAKLLVPLGLRRSRKVISDWVQKAELQPESGKSSNRITLDKMDIRTNDLQF
jgi:putative transposase